MVHFFRRPSQLLSSQVENGARVGVSLDQKIMVPMSLTLIILTVRAKVNITHGLMLNEQSRRYHGPRLPTYNFIHTADKPFILLLNIDIHKKIFMATGPTSYTLSTCVSKNISGRRKNAPT